MTWEAVARLRVVADVVGTEVLDADTVRIRWAGTSRATTLSLTAAREEWARSSGFHRIEVMDALIATVGPPSEPGDGSDDDRSAPGSSSAEVARRATDPEPGASAEAEAETGTRWDSVRDRLHVVVDRPGEHPGGICWPIAGVLEAHVELDRSASGAVTPADAASWAVDPGDVRAAALTNLAAIGPDLDPIGPGQPAWVPTTPRAHPPAWLAAPERLLEACDLPAAIVLAPMPSELVVVDPAAEALLGSILASTAAMVAGASRLLCPAPLLATPDGVAPWQPPPEHPCAGAVADLR